MKMQTTLMREGNAQNFINLLIAEKANFVLSMSTYTIGINSKELQKKFVTTMQAGRTFGAFSKLKKDLKTKPVPDVDKSKLRYYVHNFKSNVSFDTVFNIDLKSAYATILMNDGMITQDTFDYLRKLSKQQRLASVGMLASRKNVFDFKVGKIHSKEEIMSDFSPYFFYLVKRTSDIMDELKKICGMKHLFTWVDGIYFIPDESVMSDCMAYLDSINFPYSSEVLERFSVEIMRTYTRVHFYKEGKLKPFNLPHTDNGFKKIFHETVLSSKPEVKKVVLKNTNNDTEKSKSKKE